MSTNCHERSNDKYRPERKTHYPPPARIPRDFKQRIQQVKGDQRLEVPEHSRVWSPYFCLNKRLNHTAERHRLSPLEHAGDDKQYGPHHKKDCDLFCAPNMFLHVEAGLTKQEEPVHKEEYGYALAKQPEGELHEGLNPWRRNEIRVEESGM